MASPFTGNIGDQIGEDGEAETLDQEEKPDAVVCEPSLVMFGSGENQISGKGGGVRKLTDTARPPENLYSKST